MKLLLLSKKSTNIGWEKASYKPVQATLNYLNKGIMI